MSCVWTGFDGRLRCVWREFAQHANVVGNEPWPFIESRALSSERRLRCVWIGFEVRLRCVLHEFAQDANVVGDVVGVAKLGLYRI